MILTGRIGVTPCGEGELLALDDTALAEWLDGHWKNQKVYAVYGFSPEPITPATMLADALALADGAVFTQYGDRYSEVTGYLYTWDEGYIGGHDMVAIFDGHVGDYGCLIVQDTPIDLMTLAEQA